MNPLVSVVLAVRNGSAYLEPAIVSVLQQTYARIEVILVDDGSVDETGAIMARFAKRDGRVVVVRQASRGLAAALNEGIKIARGDWIARMDADDVADPRRIHAQVAYATTHELDVCGGYVRLFGRTLPRTMRYYVSHDAILLRLLFNSAFCHPATILRTELVRSIAYDESLPAAQDYDLWARLAAAGARMGNLPQVVLRYRFHGSQTTRARNQAQVATVTASALAYWRWFCQRFEVPVAESQSLIPLLIDKSRPLSTSDFGRAFAAFRVLAERRGDPEHVLSTNLFNLLVRSPGAWGSVTDVEKATALRMSTARSALLRCLRFVGFRSAHPMLLSARRHFQR
jgi:glycosyltransferase involved in cell wall biosynthesis